MSRRAILVALLSLGLTTTALATCGGDDDTTTTSAPDGQSTSAPTTAPPSTAPADGATVASVVAATQRDLDEEFAANPDPAPQVLGAIELSCDRSGPVRAGDLLACTGTPRTEPGFELDPVGVLFVVLDDVGTVAWTTGTDLPGDDQALERLTASATPGLFCRDLVDPELQTEAGFFGAATTNESFGYFLSVVYWFVEGRPERMDEEGNGIPCETVHDSDVVAAVWRGGPVG